MFTEAFLKYNHGEIIPPLNPGQFDKAKMVKIGDLWANQSLIDNKTLTLKMKGKNLSVCYVLSVNNKFILIDGHHTVIAKKLNGQQKVKVMFLALTLNPLT